VGPPIASRRRTVDEAQVFGVAERGPHASPQERLREPNGDVNASRRFIPHDISFQIDRIVGLRRCSTSFDERSS